MYVTYSNSGSVALYKHNFNYRYVSDV